eukprot:GHVR01170771.1.p1 GENE.GHVR01170771.1~~GHVR01170771.1.p1  ORF type:complete len:239 (+),score=31.24 GHVR01170771.1:77-793(+)
MIPKIIKPSHVTYSEKNILSYDPKKLISWGWMFLAGSDIGLSTLIGLILVIGTTIGFGFLQCKKDAPAFDKCIPLPRELSALTLFTHTSFVLTFFVSIVIGRWLSVREHLGVCNDRSVAACVHFDACVFGTDEVSTSMRFVFWRLINLAHHTIYKSTNGKVLRVDFDDFLEVGLVKTDELEIMMSYAPNHRVTICYAWIDMLVNHAADSGLMRMPTENLITLLDDITTIRTQVAYLRM